jgi:hypothetical protein
VGNGRGDKGGGEGCSGEGEGEVGGEWGALSCLADNKIGLGIRSALHLLGTCSRIHSPELGDIVESGTYRPPSYEKAGRYHTTTLCQSWLYPPRQGLRNLATELSDVRYGTYSAHIRPCNKLFLLDFVLKIYS